MRKLISKLFDSKTQEEINNIISSGFTNFTKSRIKLPDDYYYFIKVSNSTVMFCSLEYNFFTDKGYIQPIAYFKENFKTTLYPTFYKDYFNHKYISNLKIEINKSFDRLITIIGSLEIVNIIYKNKENLINNDVVTIEIDDITFNIAVKSENKLVFFINNDDNEILKLASYDFKYSKYSKELILEKLKYVDSLTDLVNSMNKNKLIVTYNNVKF